MDKSTCLDASVALLHADVSLTLMYQSEDEVYYGPLLTYEQPDLSHSTNYKIRVASASPQGIFSTYSAVVPARTKKPTAPTAPRDTEMLTSTGGAVHVQWTRPKDTGGAKLVEYFVQAAQLEGGKLQNANYVQFLFDIFSIKFYILILLTYILNIFVLFCSFFEISLFFLQVSRNFKI